MGKEVDATVKRRDVEGNGVEKSLRMGGRETTGVALSTPLRSDRRVKGREL